MTLCFPTILHSSPITTMQRNSLHIGVIIAFLLFGLGTAKAFAGEKVFPDSLNRGYYSLLLYTNGGFSYFSTVPGVPTHLQTQVYKINPVFTARLVWLPDHRLSIGVESGYTTMYSYKLLNARLPGELSITAVPVLLEFSMPVTKRLRVFAGPGSFFETSHLNYEGKVNSKMVSLGWMAAGAYTFLMKDRFTLSGEIKWLDAAESQHAILCTEIQLMWKIVSW